MIKGRIVTYKHGPNHLRKPFLHMAYVPSKQLSAVEPKVRARLGPSRARARAIIGPPRATGPTAAVSAASKAEGQNIVCVVSCRMQLCACVLRSAGSKLD